MPYCDADTFQTFLDNLSELDKEEFKIVILNNGAFHKAKRLVIPQNIGLIFLPAYGPELNPAEQIWRLLKKAICNRAFTTLDELSDFLCAMIQKTISHYRISIFLSAFKTIFDLNRIINKTQRLLGIKGYYETVAKQNVKSCDVDPLFLHVDPPWEAGNNCKSLMMHKNTWCY